VVFTIVDGVVGMAGMLLFVAAVLGVSAALSDGLAGMLTHLGLGLPGFGTEQSGNALYHTYDQLRWASIIMLVCAISVCAALGRWRGALRRAAPLMLFLFIFPYLWDYGAQVSYASGAWILNPLYSFDADGPCPDAWDDTRITHEYDISPYRTGGDPDMVCRPELRVEYVVEQAARTTTISAGGHTMELVADAIPAGLAEVFVNVFGAMHKAFTVINLTVAAAVAGIILDMYAGMVAGAMPVWAMMCMVPRLDSLSARFLASIPAMLLAPPLTSIIIVVGSSALASAPPDSPAALLGVWAAAVAILFLASLLPAAMVPAVRGVVQLSTTVLVSGVLASATIVSGTISGASSGARYGRPGAIHGGLEGLAAGHLGAAGGSGPAGPSYGGAPPLRYGLEGLAARPGTPGR